MSRFHTDNSNVTFFFNLGTFAKSHDTHLNWYVELILLPLWWESGHSSLTWCIWLKCHLREPNFEHYLYLQQVLEVFLTANRETSINWNILTPLSKHEAFYLWWSYPISGLCKIPRILCNLSMATLCWKLDNPATIQIYKTDQSRQICNLYCDGCTLIRRDDNHVQYLSATYLYQISQSWVHVEVRVKDE